MEDNKDILIDRFLNNELSSEEHFQFTKRMEEDAALRAEVELHKEIIKGLERHGENQLRVELAGVYKEVKNDLKDYKPPKGGSFLGKLIGWIVFVAVVWLAADFILHGGEGGPIWPRKHNHPEKQKSEIEEIEEKKPARITVRRDTIFHMETIYHTIKTKHKIKGDSIADASEAAPTQPVPAK